jgi:sugar phosphate isomerase/epimerase
MTDSASHIRDAHLMSVETHASPPSPKAFSRDTSGGVGIKAGGLDVSRIALLSSTLSGFSPSQVVEAAQAAGLDAIEWGLGPGQAVTLDEVEIACARKLCDENGIVICGVCIQDAEVTLAQPAALRRYAAAAMLLGAPHVRVFAPPFNGEDLRPALEQAVELVDDLSVSLLLEVSPGTSVPSPELARQLLEDMPAARVGVLYDPGNMMIEGHLAPRLAVEVLGPYLRHVHVKNVIWERINDRWCWRHARLLAGLVDWRLVISELDRAGYAGRLAIDHLGADAAPELLETEVALLRSLTG